MSNELTEVQKTLKDEIMEYCDEEFAKTLKLTDYEIKTIEKFTRNVSGGYASFLPIICMGDRCVYRYFCPLLKIKKAPISFSCPFEMYMIRKWTVDYIKALDIDPDNKNENTLLSEIVEVDIMNARVNAILGDEGMIIENPIGISEQTGEPVTRKEMHAAMLIKEKTQNRKDKLLKAFLATRESKVKSVGNSVDITRYIAELREKANIIANAHGKVSDGILLTKELDIKKREPIF